jgi:arylsulfatase A-like enzyme
MAKVRNVLFVMCDQLRADHLSCMGHPRLETPHIDSLAERGVLFTRAVCSAPVCGPSRMSFYTGRSMRSHGVVWNFVPLPIHERMIGDYLRPHGMTVALVGKTHHEPDRTGMARLGIDPDSTVGKSIMTGAFDPIEHYEGHANPGPQHSYVRYLRARGYTDTSDPWGDYVQSALDEQGRLASGWLMRNVHLPARVREEDSETAYTTDVAIKFIRDQGERQWFLHLSYIKPHWPYLAPAPYHATYGAEDCAAVVRHPREREAPHPVYAAYQKHPESLSFSRDEVVARVKPAYMGLVKQLDDHFGRVLAALAETGRLDDTLVVFTSDHGDYLGDHWLGDKELFHEPSVRIPFIVYDPDAAADSTRGRRDERLVEGIDFLPTAMEALGLALPHHLLEGRSLLPLLRAHPAPRWRDFAVSEIDYCFREARATLEQDPRRCRGTMLFDGRWKYVAWEGFRPQLFDLQEDPAETVDLGADPGRRRVRAAFRDRMFEWACNRKTAVTLPDDRIVISERDILPRHGIKIGIW